MTLLLASAVDLAVLLAAALLIAAALRRQSAALRHAVLSAAVIAGIALPALELVVPQWPLPLPGWTGAASEASGLRWAATAPVAEEVTPEPVADRRWPAVTWDRVALLIWLLGALATSGGLALGFVRLRRVSARAARLHEGAWHEATATLAAAGGLRRNVALLLTEHPSLLVTYGVFAPKIVLPAGAAAWPDERRRAVLVHELAHIRRGDWLVQLAAEALRAVYWFNPFAWIVCRRLREESEYACDDAVLAGGLEPTRYATHLLDVARHAVGQPRVLAAAPAIAHPSTLERRIAAMLTRQRNHSPLTRRGGALALAAALAITIPTAAVGLSAGAPAPAAPPPAIDIALASPVTTTPSGTSADARVPSLPAPERPAPTAAAAAPAQQSPAAISGTVLDPSGAVLPGVEMTLTDAQFGVRFSTVSDGAGSFRFRDLQPGRYQLDARLPGFTTVSNVMTLAAGAAVQRSLTLPLGTLQETQTVRCSGATAASGLAAAHASGSRAVARDWLFDGESPLAQLRRAADRAAAPPLAAQGAAGKPVRVGGQIKAPRKVKDMYPRCPSALLPTPGLTLVLTGRIGVDGYMNDVGPVVSAGDNATAQSEFLDAAMEAVRQWVFTPTLLNNTPVAVELTATIHFSR